MNTTLRTLVLGALAVLLLLQPAARAGAGCGESMLTGSCGCTAPEKAEGEGARSCCQGASGAAEHESAPDDSRPRLGSDAGCACTASPLPDLPGAPRTSDSFAGTLLERFELAARCAAAHVDVLPAAQESPPRAPHPRPLSLVPRGSTARTLAFLGTCLR
ncbi:MAG: hypothetical protein NTY35_11865 [Planctomycetota bacterium]|nr:hypothetical protein [Planctomycetota bacterium]